MNRHRRKMTHRLLKGKMDSYIRTTGEVVEVLGERLYGVRTPIGKVVQGFVERREAHIRPELDDRVILQFKHENMSRARIVEIVTE